MNYPCLPISFSSLRYLPAVSKHSNAFHTSRQGSSKAQPSRPESQHQAQSLPLTSPKAQSLEPAFGVLQLSQHFSSPPTLQSRRLGGLAQVADKAQSALQSQHRRRRLGRRGGLSVGQGSNVSHGVHGIWMSWRFQGLGRRMRGGEGISVGLL
jgi:hypothetical protein